ncbi:hypothetical protein NSZ01_15420 [Nocardioides szechwanensis]|uniref:Uncharacterized protein n=1 Tax=Nocardioides szechwanensis TaxID=1005944 RepID=A0A1G9Z2D9_9ACTN|nr:hypothetical protein [Nocardioides szechwanensis]GEP33774.1 hypothetical protein NSZ01_15420 [Nocardioides szechwanensis]SDN14911.1 hypothetical protein SAMN05192576_1565 [Nocardioides szechwanensis]
MPATLEPVRSDPWAGLVDDAAIFPPGDAPLTDATAAYAARTAEEGAGLVGTFVLRDTDLPQVRGFAAPLSVVVTGGAGQIEGPAGLCRKLGLDLAGVEIALRDPSDLVGNARRVALAVDSARSSGALDFEVPIYVELPDSGHFGHWSDPIQVLLENDFRLKMRTGGLHADDFPDAQKLADWLDLMQAYAIPFKCTAGLHRAVRNTAETGFEHHGFLNILMATAMYFAGATVPEVRDTLERRDGEALANESQSLDLVAARRWFTSFGSCSVAEPLADLRALGLVS